MREPVDDGPPDRKDTASRAAAVVRGPRPRRPVRLALFICVIGLLLTGLSTWAAAGADENTEQRLLEVQTKQVGAVLSTAILLIQAPLDTALSIQSTASPGDTATFRRFMAASVGAGKPFVSASIWQKRRGRLARLAQLGAAPALPAGGPAMQGYLSKAMGKSTFTVRAVVAGQQRRIAYALAARGSGYVVYAERAIPASRRSPVDRDSAFADLHYAIYLGPKDDLDSLSTTDVVPSSLPLGGHTATAKVPFGDTQLTVVTSPRHHLGATLSQRLPWILLLGGIILTLLAARTGQQLVRRRQRAEDSAAVVTELYDRVEIMYGQERELSERLQRALLPPVIPAIPHLEVAVEYVAGAHGVDIGGDWYSLVALDPDHFAFVVGDVSGRGIDAVAVMARARFTLRAYLLDGSSAAVALEKCSSQFDIVADGHIITAIVGIGNWRTGEITVANAGHPAPLLLTGTDVGYIEVPPGPPLGTGPTSYATQTVTMAPGSTLFCFTDGLVERRTEDIDTGLRRLVDSVAGHANDMVDDLVAHTLSAQRGEDAADDIAVLAIRWSPA